MEALGDADGVLVVDETGFLKKVKHSVGVSRQYSGTAGRIENCQVGVFLAYASRYGQSLIDRRLYLPKGWVDDEARRASAQIPQEQAFATKPEIACDLIAAALDAGVPCARVLADAPYGSDSRLRRMLEDAVSLMFWRFAPIIACALFATRGSSKPAPKRRRMRWNRRLGRAMLPAKAPKACGSMTGRASLLGLARMHNGSAGF